MFGEVLTDMEIMGGFIPQGKKVIITDITGDIIMFKVSENSRFEVMTTIDKVLCLN